MVWEPNVKGQAIRSHQKSYPILRSINPSRNPPSRPVDDGSPHLSHYISPRRLDGHPPPARTVTLYSIREPLLGAVLSALQKD